MEDYKLLVDQDDASKNILNNFLNFGRAGTTLIRKLQDGENLNFKCNN
jgi:hypothetical protein